MSTASQEAPKLKVFVSYSREDLEFADQLVAGLILCGFEPLIDRTGISGGEAWQQRLGNLMREADTVAFVLSRASATSPICGWEVEEAVRLSKRILPVVCGTLEGTSPPSQLQDLNYIFFYRDPETPGSGFGVGLSRLVAALNTDIGWVREHTRLLVRASEWAAGGRPVNRLLSGNDVADAKAWAASRPKDAPEPTNLHLDFILASEQAEAVRAGTEQKRLAEIAAAQTEREHALKAAEVAQQEKAEASQRLVRRTVAGLVVAVSLAIIATGAGFYAFAKQRDAQQQATRADQQRARAEQNLTAINQALEVLDNASKPEVVAAKFFDLARNYASQDRLDEAATLYKRSLKIIENGAGADSSQAAAVRAELGIVYEKQGHADEAEPLLQQALAFHEKANDGEHPHVAIILMHLANVVQGRGQPQEAEKLRANALRIARKNALAEIPVFYGTDRARDEESKNRLAYGSDRGRRLELGQASAIFSGQVSIAEHVDLSPNGGALSTSVGSDERGTGSVDIAELKTLSPTDFSAAARERLVHGKRYPGQALIFVHGFDTSFELAVHEAAKIAQALKYDGLVFVYSWPSGGGVASYTYDRESSQAAEPYLRHFIDLVCSQSGAKAVGVIAFGMGGQPALDTLRDIVSAGVSPSLLNEVVLLVPDIDPDLFANIAARLSGRLKGMTVYASSSDRGVAIARSFWGGQRLGDVPAEGPHGVPGVDTIDVSALGADAFRFGDSRSQIQRDRVLADIGRLLQTGQRPPDQRSPELLPRQSKAGTYWQMRP